MARARDEDTIDAGENEDADDDDDAVPTVLEVPAGRARATPVAVIDRRTPATVDTRQAGSGRPRPAVSSAEAMLQDEIVRNRIFLRMMVLLCGLGTLTLPFLGGDGTAKAICAASLGTVAALYAGLYLHIRDARRYSERRVAVLACVAAAAAFGAVYYFGIYSSAPAVLAVGIYVYGLGGGPRATLALYLTIALGQLALAVLLVTGVLPDRGLVVADELSLRERLLIQGALQTVYLITYLTARSSRRGTVDAVTRLEQAVRAVGQRDALLAEARQELDRALQIGGPGRFTDQKIGSFVLGVVIGRGGMGEVYDASHVDTGQPAAVKLLHASVLANPALVTRFVREARIAGALASPYVVRVLEVGEPTDSWPYLAMERLRGHDLAHHLRRNRRLPLPQVLELCEQVGAGLEAARVAGIVHRDLKPHNLFLAKQGSAPPRWKILDFGVSKLMDQSGTLTRGNVVGTPAYMAPEQARDGEVDHRADLYALAANAYRALTGQPAFTGKDIPTTLYDVVHRMPVRPSSLIHLPEELDLILAVALAKQRDDRFASAGELVAALAAAARGHIESPLRLRAEALLARLPWGTER